MKHNFTLVELLVTVGIIAILAGLVIPAVISSQNQGRITQAKSDMNAIKLALKSVETTYGKIISKDTIGNIDITGSDYVDTYTQNTTTSKTLSIGRLEPGEADTDEKKLKARKEGVVYKAFICELTDPNNSGIKNRLNFNTRRIKFLDPSADYDPLTELDLNTSQSNYIPPKEWLDPWGNMYKILIDKSFSGFVNVSSNKRLAGSIHIYSSGPDTIDNNGDNEDQGGATGTDDIATWHK